MIAAARDEHVFLLGLICTFAKLIKVAAVLPIRRQLLLVITLACCIYIFYIFDLHCIDLYCKSINLLIMLQSKFPVK